MITITDGYLCIYTALTVAWALTALAEKTEHKSDVAAGAASLRGLAYRERVLAFLLYFGAGALPFVHKSIF